MRKWLFFLLVIVAVYGISQVGRRSKSQSSFIKNISETISIVVWILIIVYTLGFFYWLYTELFK
jgi:hypothetical protein